MDLSLGPGPESKSDEFSDANPLGFEIMLMNILRCNGRFLFPPGSYALAYDDSYRRRASGRTPRTDTWYRSGRVQRFDLE